MFEADIKTDRKLEKIDEKPKLKTKTSKQTIKITKQTS
jgi:hypothetical protein